MVSFQESSVSSNIQRKTSTIQEFDDQINSEKKRRWEDRSSEGEENLENDHHHHQWNLSKFKKTKPLLFDDIKFHHHLFETPSSTTLLDDSKDCRRLDIQSGKVHFYNTKNHQKMNEDWKQSPKRVEIGHMSLDLELNLLPYDSPRTQVDDESSTKNDTSGTSTTCKDHSAGSRELKQVKSDNALKWSCPSWMSLEEDQQEMVAAACMKCHMLVMLCKSSPACPNCKFMHPPDHQSPVNLFKPRFSTLGSWKN